MTREELETANALALEVERWRENERLQMDRAIRAEAEIARLRVGIKAIKDGTFEDVVWFDLITTLYDFCDQLLGDVQSENK